jgi:hypothetical protein
VLPLLLANISIFAPKEAEGQYLASIEDATGSSGSGEGNTRGCLNRPSENNGDCEEATKNGTTIYYCVNSWVFHDCVK